MVFCSLLWLIFTFTYPSYVSRVEGNKIRAHGLDRTIDPIDVPAFESRYAAARTEEVKSQRNAAVVFLVVGIILWMWALDSQAAHYHRQQDRNTDRSRG